ncbi:hypothetical protein SAMN05216389_104210 [Oceanobacillus limi]|uniref:Uncharacterized protein n=1 Tax=Oceanobacillus limi TaxID=930131 RepID=A0A1I0B6I2_9BACI|nr:hypothetical protein [Oceanobacillus limi]SET02483.1 hypothetical protein SAMN05216389_104210 [Oceanobacillus limi]
MLSETFLDFCFVEKETGNLSNKIESTFEGLFKHERRLHWYLNKKVENGLEIIVAEVKGISKWQTEDEVIDYLESNAEEGFWNSLQGYQLQVLPVSRGCCKSG